MTARCCTCRSPTRARAWGSELLVDATRLLSLGVSLDVEARWYLSESYWSGPLLANALADDQRYRLGARGEYRLLRAPQIELLVDYSLLVSRSNMAFDASDPEHAFDYDDRNFVQQLFELGTRVRL